MELEEREKAERKKRGGPKSGTPKVCCITPIIFQVIKNYLHYKLLRNVNMLKTLAFDVFKKH